MSRLHDADSFLQPGLDLWPGETTAGQVLERIRTQSRDEVEKGRWFENLVGQVLLNRPEMEVTEVYRWSEWPDRETLTGLDGRDLGTDLVVRLLDGSWVAVQCKCHTRDHRVPKSEIDSFLSHSQREPFALRWVVATSLWSRAAEVLLEIEDRPVRRFDFMDWTNEIVAETAAQRPVRQPWALQTTAIADIVEGLRNHERGRLVMACGTGKTFVALRVAEQIVPDGGAVLFLAPSIALISQARREWLRHTTRKLRSLVICSDKTAGGRNEEDVRVSELECPVTTEPAAISAALATTERTRVVFCTYQSLRQVSLAQREHSAMAFDLTIADEAHRTTGIDRTRTEDNGLFAEDHFAAFQGVHHADLLVSEKRLYMTATPRIYTTSSKARRREEGHTVVDMADSNTYGPELHRLSFARAVEHNMLSDYRVIVLGVRDSAVTPGLRQQLVALGEEQDESRGRSRRRFVVRASDMMRVLGTSLAINGVTEGDDFEKPARLLRTLGFANTIKSSRFYAEALNQSLVRRTTTIRKRKQDGDDVAAALPLEVRHLDASHSALERNAALRELESASVERKAQMVCNVKLFTEGVDVPSLDAVVFMEPRDSQVDVVQAVGRVMRKAPGKRFGYIVLPIAIESGKELVDALEQGTEGYAAVGRVLRALQAHDGRLAEEPLTFVQAYEVGGNGTEDYAEWEQETLDIEQASEGIFAQVVKASGLGRPGLLVSQEIEVAVKSAAAVLVESELEGELAEVLGLPVEVDGGAREVCTIGALLLANACLLHRRLCDVSHMGGLVDLNAVGGSQDPRSVLMGAWNAILKRDYAPVFEPALAVLEVLPFIRVVMDAVRSFYGSDSF